MSNQTTFVSSHYRGRDPADIERYIRGKCHEIKSSSDGSQWNSKHCPWCPDTKGKADNLWKLYFTKETGAYYCQRCKAKGSFFDFQKSHGDIPDVYGADGNKAQAKKIYKKPVQTTVKAHETALDWFPDVEKFCTDRGFLRETLNHYRVGAAFYTFKHDDETWHEHQCVTFPWYARDQKGNEVVWRVKARAIDNKKFMYLDPVGGAWGWFGWHTITRDTTEVVITEGEFDAMAVWQQTHVPAISLPNGCNSLPVELLPYLEQFKTIYLWMDDDYEGQKAMEKFADKLGVHRVKLVYTRNPDGTGPKDANEAMQAGHNLMDKILAAKNKPHKQIIEYGDMEEDVLRELLHAHEIRGTPLNSLPRIQSIVKGIREGELTVFTGATGSGKTTILSQLTLDILHRGVPSMWGSFEIKNVRLAKKMLNQYAQTNLEKNVAEFRRWSDSFKTNPLYFMKFFGSTSVDSVLDAMEYAVYVHDVRFIVLDNLQFMTSGQGRGYEKFDIQDEAISRFRKFATDKNVHVVLVIHPRKPKERGRLEMDDIFGTAKATQESDLVLILQNLENGQKAVQVAKNRFDGDLGEVLYQYDRDTNRIRELTDEEVEVYTLDRAASASKSGTYRRTNYANHSNSRYGNRGF